MNEVFPIYFNAFRSQDNSGGGIWAGRTGFNFQQRLDIFCTPQRLDRLRSSASLLSNGYGGSFPVSKAERS
jgi:hypothetical protein